MDTSEANVPFPEKEWTPVRPTCRNLVTNGHPVAETQEEGPLIRGPEALVPLFSANHHLCNIDGTLVLEGLSAAATRSRRRQAARAVSWARASGFMGNPAPSGPRPARRRGAGEGGSPHRGPPPPGDGDKWPTAP